MIKLSELQNDAKVIDDNGSVYSVEEVKGDLKYFGDKSKRLFTTTEYEAGIDAREMLESAIEREYDNMYEDWDERIWEDITDDDIEKLQAVIDEILSRNKEQNTAYYQNKEIEVFR